MAREIPKAQKVYTTTYHDFKGVDFTNDPSNIWYRRTPDGVNMLPDEAGRPFKRTGWKIEVTADEIAELYATDTGNTAPSEVTIRRCHYFELAGLDHIIIFSNIGVFIYREVDGVDGSVLLSSKSLNPTSVISYDPDMIDSYDRAFFFEGGGKAGFYTYGGFKIWAYTYDDTNGFTWQSVDPYIPRVNISVDARHEAGTSYEAVNMLSDFICEEFQNNGYLSVTSYAPNTITVDEVTFIITAPTAQSYPATYTFTYTEADHSWLLNGDQVLISAYGINTNSTPADGDQIVVTVGKTKRINLPKPILSTDGMEVYASVQTQFDTLLTLKSSGSPSATKDVVLTNSGAGNSYLLFYDEWLPLVEGEDAIRVIYPRNAVTPTEHDTGAITINIGA